MTKVKKQARLPRSKEQIYNDYKLFIQQVKDSIGAMSKKQAVIRNETLAIARVDNYTLKVMLELGIIKIAYKEGNKRFYSWTYGEEAIDEQLGKDVYEKTIEYTKQVSKNKEKDLEKAAMKAAEADTNTSPAAEVETSVEVVSPETLVFTVSHLKFIKGLPVNGDIFVENLKMQFYAVDNLAFTESVSGQFIVNVDRLKKDSVFPDTIVAFINVKGLSFTYKKLNSTDEFDTLCMKINDYE